VSPDEFRRLLSPAGQEAIAVAQQLQPRETDFLSHLQALSRRFPTDVARVTLEVAILRNEAQAKFPFADRLYLTREALEQTSSYEISSYRAQRYRGFEPLIDLGCSVGSDTLALAQVAPTLGIDHDPLRLLMAKANLQALRLSDNTNLLQANLVSALPIAPCQATGLFFDPGRRQSGQRIYSVRNYQPPLSIIQGWLPGFPNLGVKISPGVRLDEIADYQAEVEFISLQGELKEAVLWFGNLRTAYRRATLLPGGHTLWVEKPGSSQQDLAPDLSAPLAYLYEPDPAILRAGLVRKLAVELNAFQLDADIAYLTSKHHTPNPFARAWQVEDWFPFQLKKLRQYLREQQVGKVTVKKRGSPLQPEALIQQLRLKGENERVLFLTHLAGKPVVIITNVLKAGA
jgi:hypothetical protein